MHGFRQFVESTRPNVYHVTWFKNLPSIARSGLDYVRHAGSNFEASRGTADQDLLANAKRGNFFVNHIMPVYQWINIFEIQANVYSQIHPEVDLEKDGLFPVILRFRLNRTKSQPDPHKETPHDRYTDKVIPPEGLEIWGGSKWIPIRDWRSINPQDMIDSHPVSHSTYAKIEDDPEFTATGGDVDSYFNLKKWKRDSVYP